METVCKHILDGENIPYDDEASLPHLYHLTTTVLNLAPSQHAEKLMKIVLGSATAVVEALGALRNVLGDAHGKGANSATPDARHAELAVNLSGAVTTFLISTWETRATRTVE